MHSAATCVQGRQPEQAARLIADAQAVQAAGASLLVLECVPHQLARAVTSAADYSDDRYRRGAGIRAQVLVLHDMLGMNSRPPKFVRNFMAGASSVRAAVEAYRDAVKARAFPGAEHGY